MDRLRQALATLRMQGGEETIFQFSQAIFSICMDPADEPEKENKFLQFLYLLPGLRKVAFEVREKAISYRDFRVGCAVLAVNPDLQGEERWNIFGGANVKVTQDARPICAEQIAVQSARAWRFTHIVAIVVVGIPQKDQGSGAKEIWGLDPCQECRNTLDQTPGIHRDTYIATFNAEQNLWEMYLFWELLARHERGYDSTAIVSIDETHLLMSSRNLIEPKQP